MCVDVLVSELFDAIWREVPVESSPPDFELIDHVADEGIVLGVLEHCLGVLASLFVHDLWPATSAPTPGSGLQTGAGIFDDQLPLELALML